MSLTDDDIRKARAILLRKIPASGFSIQRNGGSSCLSEKSGDGDLFFERKGVFIKCRVNPNGTIDFWAATLYSGQAVGSCVNPRKALGSAAATRLTQGQEDQKEARLIAGVIDRFDSAARSALYAGIGDRDPAEAICANHEAMTSQHEIADEAVKQMRDTALAQKRGETPDSERVERLIDHLTSLTDEDLSRACSASSDKGASLLAQLFDRQAATGTDCDRITLQALREWRDKMVLKLKQEGVAALQRLQGKVACDGAADSRGGTENLLEQLLQKLRGTNEPEFSCG